MKDLIFKNKYRSREKERVKVKRFHTNGALLWQNWLLAVSMILVFGTLCRIAGSHLNLTAQSPVLLPIALNNFPEKLSGWTGRNVEIPKHIQKVAGNDDFLYRFYMHESSSGWVNLYVAYSGRPGKMLGHRPEICYTADGWIHESTEQSQFYDIQGGQVPCSIHRFRKPGNSYEDIVVLDFYVLNGKVVDGERDFSGMGWRSPNLNGNPARYVAQVQISSTLENSVRMAAKDMTGQILTFLPDEDGKVKVASYVNVTSDALP